MKTPVVFEKSDPSILKCSPDVLEVTVIVAVAVAQDGCVMLMLGADGVLG